MSVSIWQINGEQAIESTDVVIIGAGLLGCSAALLCKQAGYSVTLIEARDVGLGASSRNAGFMLIGLDLYYHQAEETYGPKATREIWQLSQQTHQFWQQLIQKYDVRWENCTSLLLAESEAEARDLEQAIRRMDAEGFPCEYLSSDPLKRGYFAAIRQPADGGLHPYQLVQAIFRESEATLIENSEVYSIESAGHEVIVSSRRVIVHAQKVLICVNGYAPRLHPFFKGKIIPTRAQCLATAPLPEPIIGAVGYSGYGYMYYRDLPNGGLLLGGGRKAHKALENNTTDDATSDPVQQTLDAYLKARFPEINVPVIRRWAGIMGFTADGLPLVGTLPGDNRVGFALGLNGHGLSLGASVAERAVDMLLNGTAPGVFDAKRLS